MTEDEMAGWHHGCHGTIALGVGFRGMGPAVADVMWVVVLPFYKFRPPPSLLQQRPSILRPQHPQRPRRHRSVPAGMLGPWALLPPLKQGDRGPGCFPTAGA